MVQRLFRQIFKFLSQKITFWHCLKVKKIATNTGFHNLKFLFGMVELAFLGSNLLLVKSGWYKIVYEKKLEKVHWLIMFINPCYVWDVMFMSFLVLFQCYMMLTSQSDHQCSQTLLRFNLFALLFLTKPDQYSHSISCINWKSAWINFGIELVEILDINGKLMWFKIFV